MDVKYFLAVLAMAVVAGSNAFCMLVRVESEACFDDDDGMGTDTECSIAFADPAAALYEVFKILIIINRDYSSADFLVGPCSILIQILLVISMIFVLLVSCSIYSLR